MINVIDNFISEDDIHIVLEDLAVNDYRWDRHRPEHRDYSFNAPMARMYRALFDKIPDAIPNEAFFFRYLPEGRVFPFIHSDDMIGTEHNVIVYLKGQPDCGTAFYKDDEGNQSSRHSRFGSFPMHHEDCFTEVQKVNFKVGRALFHPTHWYHKAFPSKFTEERLIWVCRYFKRSEM